MRNINWEVAKEVNYPVLYEDTIDLGTVRFDLVVNSCSIIVNKALPKMGLKKSN